ncbi:MAG: hypothetical protein ACYC3P_10990 [Bellilinea sp.]
MQLNNPHLTFFCELDSPELSALFSDPEIIRQLTELKASISLGLLDLSAERAKVAHQLNLAGIPLHAWLLLPMEQGYWFNLDNAPQALHRYQDFRQWTLENGLHWEAVGLDIEPDIHLMQSFNGRLAAGIKSVVRRLLARPAGENAKKNYRQLAQAIQNDGWEVESYQFPLIVDERRARSKFIQTLGGIIDLPVDREVLMLYSSFFRPRGAAILASYAGEAGGIGLGVTGGGVDTGGLVDSRPLDWNELQRDLLFASRYSDQLYIFSLEGCVRQGFLEKLSQLDWSQNVLIPAKETERIQGYRRLLRAFLWTTAHPWLLIGLLAIPILLWRWLRRCRGRS